MHSYFERLSFSQWCYVVVGLLSIVIVSYFYLWRGTNLGATITISSGDFSEQIRVSGTVIAAESVELGFATSGRIAAIYANVGQRVPAGTILAETENGDLVAAVAQKQAALAQAQANLASLQAGTRPEELSVASVSVASAEATLVNAIQNAYTASDDSVHNRADSFFTNPRTNPKLIFNIANANLVLTVERERAVVEPILVDWSLLITKLSNGNIADSAKKAQAYLTQITMFLAGANMAINQGVPDQTTTAANLSSYGTAIATARTNINAAATTLTSAVAALDSAQKNLLLKQAEATVDTITAQQAVVASAVADIRSSQAKLAATRIVASFSGIVTRMDAKVGEIISPNTSEISMQSNGIFQIETYIPEVIIVHVAPENSATITLDAYGSSVIFPATVVAVDPAETVKDGVPTYKTTLVFLKADPAIRSGMTANVTIVTDTLHNAIVIPAGAVGTKGSISYVSVVTHGASVSRTVVTGPTPSLGQAQILSGLSAGDVILLTPVPPAVPASGLP